MIAILYVTSPCFQFPFKGPVNFMSIKGPGIYKELNPGLHFNSLRYQSRIEFNFCATFPKKIEFFSVHDFLIAFAILGLEVAGKKIIVGFDAVLP